MTFYPETHYYPAGGAQRPSLRQGRAGDLARLARKDGKYRMTIVPAEFVDFPREKALALGATTTPAWPCAFARLEVSADEFLSRFPCNHIHGVYGDCVEELKTVARLLDMDVDVFA